MIYFILCCILGCVITLKLFLVLTKGYFKTNVCLTGKTALVTGGNSGMGYEVSLFLASRGCRVIIADVVNASKTVENIISTTKNPQVTYQYLDLASLTSVRKCAAILLFNEPRLDIIINNAGCAGFKHKTEDDIYKVLQVNYIGHFLLTHLLTPLLIKTKHSRVVFVTSLLAFTNNLWNKNNINFITRWRLPLLDVIFDYGNSKACVLAGTEIFAQKLSKHDVIVSSCHPGLVKTQIFRKCFDNYTEKQNILTLFVSLVVYIVVAMFGKTPREGIQSTLYCALSENVQSGDFIVDCHKFPKPFTNKFCKNIWQESIRLTDIENEEILS